MSPPDLEIVEIMRGGDLDRAGAFFGIGIFVGDDRNQAADERQPHLFALKMEVALIFRMDRDRRIAEHGFGARRRDYDEFAGLVGHRHRRPDI